MHRSSFVNWPAITRSDLCQWLRGSGNKIRVKTKNLSKYAAAKFPMLRDSFNFAVYICAQMFLEFIHVFLRTFYVIDQKKKKKQFLSWPFSNISSNVDSPMHVSATSPFVPWNDLATSFKLGDFVTYDRWIPENKCSTNFFWMIWIGNWEPFAVINFTELFSEFIKSWF